MKEMKNLTQDKTNNNGVIVWGIYFFRILEID